MDAQINTTSSESESTQTFGAERNIIPWPMLDAFVVEASLQPPPWHLHPSIISVSTSSPDGLAMSFVTFGPDSESSGRFFGIHASPHNYGEVVNNPANDPFQYEDPLEPSHDSDDFPMSSDVDNTFSFLERPGTRAEANLLWTHDLGASQYSRGSLSDCAMDRLALRAETLIGVNDTFCRPNSSSSANDMRSVIQVVDRILLSHARHSPSPIRKSPPSLAPVSLQRGTWHQDRRRVTSSERRIALGWKRRL
ncbi:hypothetical protein B0H14DRAFT_2573739 [Mycena olivaceomarginata]|nr:hypothetical protein B0H14DRAFT_2573739 [Mycena olivaceomarginata]